MFSRHTDRPEDPRATGINTAPATGMRDVVPVPVASDSPLSAPGHMDESVIGRDDKFEGTLRTQRSVRILGQLQGHIEAAKSVYVEEGAKVDADLTADEAIISGLYSGKLVCRQRLEIRSTGVTKGEIETVRLMLHEGGFIDGELHMQRPERAPAAARDSGSIRADTAPRTATVEVERTTLSSSSSSGNSSSSTR